MAFLHYKNVKVAGVAAGVPRKVINNLTCEQRVSTQYENADFVATTGVIERHTDFELTTSDLCFKAAKQLIADLGWAKEEIDAIIVVSQTHDFIFPATACIMQDRLGLSKECYAEDIQLGCSGWVYGMSNLAALLSNGSIRKALLCAGDARDQYPAVGYDDPLFGMAGTVTALEYEEGNDGIKGHFGTDGSGYDAIIKLYGGTRNPMTHQALDLVEEDGRILNGFSGRMKGMDVFSFGISTVPKSFKKFAEHFGFDYQEADYFVFHQANKKMNDMITKKLKLPVEKVPLCMPHFGNTSSASIPLTIVTELRDKARDGVRDFICCGFGVGLSWGTIRFQTNNLVISPLVEVDSDEHML